jgi:hypothetical protein
MAVNLQTKIYYAVKSNMGQSQMGQSQMRQSQMGQSQMGQSQMGQSQMGQSQMGKPSRSIVRVKTSSQFKHTRPHCED